MSDTNSSKELYAGGYLAAYLYRVPKKNHNAISQNLKKFIPWFVSNGVRLEYYHLAGKDTQETIESANASGIYMSTCKFFLIIHRIFYYGNNISFFYFCFYFGIFFFFY